ncbi:anthranilate synthase component I [Methylobacterium indicum]|uniref:Anthranilate synthase n=1 Tax=Methylobacterium indicum TaxID=1775910 RepID=A0A8H8X0M4_9HYPH|nr:anthranilate synthase component I [Methylobacterium indicum]BCM87643.1 anthranilate synthase component I [Methylobacterium indicum]
MEQHLSRIEYVTTGGIAVTRREYKVDKSEYDKCRTRLDDNLGMMIYSDYEYPNRYTQWSIAFTDPILCITAVDRKIEISACNPRGNILIQPLSDWLSCQRWLEKIIISNDYIHLYIVKSCEDFIEENRVRQPSVFSAIRSLVELFYSKECNYLGLYGSFGYDLAFQFEPIEKRQVRSEKQRDLVLYLPDNILVKNSAADFITKYEYDFTVNGICSRLHNGVEYPQTAQEFSSRPLPSSPELGSYADTVRQAYQHFKRGDLFEVVPGHTFYAELKRRPSAIAEDLRRINPAPYGFFLNLGQAEHLVGASPEMFVRVTGRRVETCPISGTIARGQDAITDADQIRTLLNSAKDVSELTMCSDVDRNDKSRVCEPGSVKVIGRRQIEIYSRLIHTVDHIEGCLETRFDALDAFLSHAWAVTVTGAPKRRAMQFIEDHEKTPRRWYGGAVGMIYFNGNLDTGLTLRTIRIEHQIAEIRVGATLLSDSIPEDEEAETHLKASALLRALDGSPHIGQNDEVDRNDFVASGLRVLLIDHDDSFVHTLAGYFRQCGAEVTTIRAPITPVQLSRYAVDLVVLSPGPARPADYKMSAVITEARRSGTPIFGVCLGLQGIVEAFGGKLIEMDVPVHGKPSNIHLTKGGMFSDLDQRIEAGRYHSLAADPNELPPALAVVATTSDNVIMAIEHVTEPVIAVQFHPESIMTLKNNCGLQIIKNVISIASTYKSDHSAYLEDKNQRFSARNRGSGLIMTDQKYT